MRYPTETNREAGAVLIVMAVLLLALLTIFGVSATRTATTESRIGVNHHLHKMAFYAADGGCRVGMALVEDNIRQKGRNDGVTVQGITLDDGDFYLNGELPAAVRPSRGNRVAHYPPDDGRHPLTELMIGATARLSTGGGVAALSGYSGAGRTAARGGAWMVFDIRSRHRGRRHNDAVVELFYRHVL